MNVDRIKDLVHDEYVPEVKKLTVNVGKFVEIVGEFFKKRAGIMEQAQLALETLLTATTKQMMELDDKDARLVPTLWVQLQKVQLQEVETFRTISSGVKSNAPFLKTLAESSKSIIDKLFEYRDAAADKVAKSETEMNRRFEKLEAAVKHEQMSYQVNTKAKSTKNEAAFHAAQIKRKKRYNDYILALKEYNSRRIQYHCVHVPQVVEECEETATRVLGRFVKTSAFVLSEIADSYSSVGEQYGKFIDSFEKFDISAHLSTFAKSFKATQFVPPPDVPCKLPGDMNILEDPRLDVPPENIPEIKERISELEHKLDDMIMEIAEKSKTTTGLKKLKETCVDNPDFKAEANVTMELHLAHNRIFDLQSDLAAAQGALKTLSDSITPSSKKLHAPPTSMTTTVSAGPPAVTHAQHAAATRTGRTLQPAPPPPSAKAAPVPATTATTTTTTTTTAVKKATSSPAAASTALTVPTRPAAAVVTESHPTEDYEDDGFSHEQLKSSSNDEFPTTANTLTAVILFDFTGSSDDELSVPAGMVIDNVQILNDLWWYGSSGDRSGSFPASYARLAHGPPSQMGRALYDFNAQDETQLTFEVDDIICEIVTESDGWSSGVVNGRSGVFPTNFVDSTFIHHA